MEISILTADAKGGLNLLIIQENGTYLVGDSVSGVSLGPPVTVIHRGGILCRSPEDEIMQKIHDGCFPSGANAFVMGELIRGEVDNHPFSFIISVQPYRIC